MSTGSSCERQHGTSTTHDCGLAYAIWDQLQKYHGKGHVKKRKLEVLKAVRLDKKPEAHWGPGCLIFSNLRRSQTTAALKNRMLPKLELGMKVLKQSCRPSKWSRQHVTETVTDIVREWLVQQDVAYTKSVRTAFLSPMVDLLFSDGRRRLQGFLTQEPGYFLLRPEDVVTFLGHKKATGLAEDIRELSIQAGASCCTKQPLAFVREAVLTASKQSTPSGKKAVFQKRKNKKRIQFAFVAVELFGTFDSNSGDLQLYS